MLGLMQTKYLVLTKNDIRKRQKEAVESVISILGISDEDASKLLRRYKWFVRCWNRGAGCLHLNEANVIRDVFVNAGMRIASMRSGLQTWKVSKLQWACLMSSQIRLDPKTR